METTRSTAPRSAPLSAPGDPGPAPAGAGKSRRRSVVRGLAIGSPRVLEVVLLRLRVIGEGTRVQIMALLDEQGSATVKEIASQLPSTHQNISKHLMLLYEAGVLRRRKDGPNVRYELADWSALWLIEQVAQSVQAHLENQQHALTGKAPTAP